MLRSEALGVLILIFVFQSFNFFFNDFFDGHYVFVSFLKDQLIDFFQEGIFDISLLLLINHTGGLGRQTLFVCYAGFLSL
jgi:hypothetical protein